MIPNPGSSRAIWEGCTCPTIDNHGGRGFGDPDKPMFVIDYNCPLHGGSGKPWKKQVMKERDQREKEKIAGVIPE